jgi:hypothetical protein
MNDIVELSNSTVPNFRSCETSFPLDLRGEVTEEDDCRLIRSKEKRSN